MRITVRLKNGDESTFEADFVGDTLGVFRADSSTALASFTAADVESVTATGAEGESVDVPRGEPRQVVVVQPITPHEPPREAYVGLFDTPGNEVTLDHPQVRDSEIVDIVRDAPLAESSSGQAGGETEAPLAGEAEDVGFHEPSTAEAATDDDGGSGFAPLYPGHRNELPEPPA